MIFDKYIGIDWSGDKNSFQKGISVAECARGNKVPNGTYVWKLVVLPDNKVDKEIYTGHINLLR